MSHFENGACPLDGQPLHRQGNTLFCPHHHTFDYARRGYINLLPSHYKKTHQPGDNQEMTTARRQFLNTGHYKPILKEVTAPLLQYISAHVRQSVFHLADAGCGEGYYTQGIMQQTQHHFPDKKITMCGFDISKECIKAATTRSKETDWAIATNAHIPILENTTDAVFSLFGFPVYAEFERILKPNGLMIIAETGIKHLFELRQAVYEHVRLKDKPKLDEINNFQLIQKTPVSYYIHLTIEQADALLKMTPHYYRMPTEKYQQFLIHPPLDMYVDVLIKVYRKIPR